jgi:hypothetical protein
LTTVLSTGRFRAVIVVDGGLDVTGNRVLAAMERERAKAAIERASKLREDAAHAAFHDTAVELVRQAAEAEQAVNAHLEAARRYERSADTQGESTD